MSKKSPVLGILGGLGPMASAYFYELLIAHTEAACDQDHIDIILNSHATTPDRTAFIIGQSDDNPLTVMVDDICRMKAYGADLIAIPCNTAHYFYDKLIASTDLPILNIMEETAACLAAHGIQRAGILATDGTVITGTYDRYLNAHKIDCIRPDKEDQSKIMHIIYEEIKHGRQPDMEMFFCVSGHLRTAGAQAIILGCTELSLIKKQYGATLPRYFIDSMDVLAYATIRACGKTPIGFDFSIDKFER
ncbi:MAG: aspartate/glutamate racemase family protein [Clostridia bacterium]|nr:aspartate/glutamate racemase family protein [Clostridia bacterium]